MLIEDLREQENYSLPVMVIPALAHEYNISEQILRTIIEQFGLFDVKDDEFFFSPSLIRRMENWNFKKAISQERAKKAAQARWNKALNENNEPKQPECTSNAQAIHEQCTSNADAMQSDAIREEKRREEKKREEKNTHIRGVVLKILTYFNFNEMNNHDKLRDANYFVNILDNNGKVDYFLKQFEAYKQYKEVTAEKKHSFHNFLGSIEKKYEDGGWNARNWVEELKKVPSNAIKSKSIDELMDNI
jgi:hypothetical protein